MMTKINIEYCVRNSEISGGFPHTKRKYFEGLIFEYLGYNSKEDIVDMEKAINVKTIKGKTLKIFNTSELVELKEIREKIISEKENGDFSLNRDAMLAEFKQEFQPYLNTFKYRRSKK